MLVCLDAGSIGEPPQESGMRTHQETLFLLNLLATRGGMLVGV